MSHYQTVYLDNNATTPLRPEVLELMTRVLRDEFGNPSSQHPWGRRAADLIQTARDQVASLLGCSADEILFTSGATESCNLGIKGALAALNESNPHLVIAMTEHKAVQEPARQLARDHAAISWLQPDSHGIISPDQLSAALTSSTRLAAIMAANNVTGAVNPIADLARLCKKRNVLFFCDITQALAKMPVNVNDLSIDLAAMSAHKMGGPKGIGALYVRNHAPRVRLLPLIAGGSQERGLRGGTENVAAIAAFGLACQLAGDDLSQTPKRLTDLRDYFETSLQNQIPQLQLLSDAPARLCNTSLFAFPGITGARLLRSLPDIAASTGAACESAGSGNHVLKAIGLPEHTIRSAVRFSLGTASTRADIDYAIRRIVSAWNELKNQTENT